MAKTKTKTGIPGLDEILNGGIPKGSSILIAGESGTGKSILSSQFLYNGATQYDENGVLVSLEERPQDLKAEMAEFGWDFQKLEDERKLMIIDASTIKIPIKVNKGFAIGPGYDIEKLMTLISAAVGRIDAQRVVVDTLPALEFGLENAIETRKTIFRLSSLLLELGCTSLMTTETLAPNKISRYGVEEFLLRGVIHMDLILAEGRVVRTLTVRKMRQSRHSLETHPFIIEDNGITVFPEEKVFI
ncbi:MAG: ATPase domain-containing protein [Candidatus Hydrothermarchaeales archaeon]